MSESLEMSESQPTTTGTTHHHQPPTTGRRAHIPAKKKPKRVHNGRIGRKHANKAYSYNVDPFVKEDLETNGYVKALDWDGLNNYIIAVCWLGREIAR